MKITDDLHAKNKIKTQLFLPLLTARLLVVGTADC